MNVVDIEVSETMTAKYMRGSISHNSFCLLSGDILAQKNILYNNNGKTAEAALRKQSGLPTQKKVTKILLEVLAPSLRNLATINLSNNKNNNDLVTITSSTTTA